MSEDLESRQAGDPSKIGVQGLSSNDDSIVNVRLVTLLRHHRPRQGDEQDYDWAR